MYPPFLPRAEDQGETKDKPRNDQRTPKHKKRLFIKIAVSFTSLIPYLIPPTDDRENSERRSKENLISKKALFLRLSPKKVDLIPEKVVSPPKKVDSFPAIVDLSV